MAQHDYIIDNQSFPATRTDINNVLQAIASNNSGASAPSTTYANQFWYETDTNKLYIRNEDNDAWIEVAVLDQANDIVSSITSETLVANIVNERTSGSGVTVDGLLIKDKEIGTTAAPATLQASAINGGQIGGRRNLLINGAMQVKQHGSPHTVANANRAFSADRFQFVNVTGSNQTVTNSTTSPSGFSNSLKIDVDTAVSGSDSGAYAYLGQKIEAQNLQHLDYGASGAKTITLSFYVRSPKTGTHVVELNAPDGSRNISGTYTVASANTWEEHSITFAGDASGTINNDTGIGLEIFFWLVAGSDLSGGGSLNTSWTTNPTANTRAVGQVNVFDNTSNVFYLTGVQLEVGSVATEFEHRSFGEELALCQRYYEEYDFPANFRMMNTTDSYAQILVYYKVEKRASATMTTTYTSDPTNPVNIQWTGGFAGLDTDGGNHYLRNFTADAEL